MLMATVAVLTSIAGMGCEKSSVDAKPRRLVAYCGVDEEFARDIFRRFTEQSKVEVSVIYDTEAGKTTGLVNKIIAEVDRPRADVFWSSELFNTIRLARMDLLEPYAPATASDIPERFKDPRHRWTACSVRGRVVAFDKSVASFDPARLTWLDLARPELARRTVMANPLFGTTRSHIAAMFALHGEETTRDYLLRLKTNGVRLVDGNSAAVRAVMDKRADLAMTDTDDVWVARRSHQSMEMCFPDMGDGGTLLIPCSVGLIRGGPGESESAKRLVDFLVSAEVERLLATSTSRNIPVREPLRHELGIDWPAESKAPFESITDWMEKSDAAVRDILLR
jgi:iron(III) transport system substrate-binding protein